MQDTSLNNEQLSVKVEFNPIIRVYITLYVGGILIASIVGIPLAIAWFCGLGQWYSRHYFDKLECELNYRTLRFKKGILFQVEKTIPLENIQDLTFIEGPLLKYFNLCVLKVETAGQGDFHGNQMKLIGIKDAQLFREKVLEQRRMINMKRENGNESVLIEIRNTLQRIEQQIAEQVKKN